MYRPPLSASAWALSSTFGAKTLAFLHKYKRMFAYMIAHIYLMRNIMRYARIKMSDIIVSGGDIKWS